MFFRCSSGRFGAGTTEAYAAGASGGGPGAGAPQGVQGGQGGQGDEWKRRDVPKHAPYLEPVSPPDNHLANRYATKQFT